MLIHRKIQNVVLTVVYLLLISAIYVLEISTLWRYMNFDGTYTTTGLILTITSSVLLALILPVARNTRSIILYTIHYFYSVPAMVFYFFSESALPQYLVLFVIFIICVNVCSKFHFKPIVFANFKEKHLLILIFSITITAILIYAGLGGMRYFSLDIASVYEFRRAAAAAIPGILGYVFSNVSNVLIPAVLLLGLILRNKFAIVGALVLAILLFGMTHHKSVLFSVALILFYFVALKRITNLSMIGWFFMIIPILASFEFAYIYMVHEGQGISQITNHFIRRLLFVPPMLDTLYVEFFINNPKYYWSSSKIGFGFVKEPFELSAPFMIGVEFFHKDDNSANTGVIGSGFANAGIIGVFIYSCIVGFLISLLQAYGKRLGHAFVSALSLMTILNIVRSSDLPTVLLTHGLLVLFVVLSLAPRLRNSESVREDDTHTWNSLQRP